MPISRLDPRNQRVETAQIGTVEGVIFFVRLSPLCKRAIIHPSLRLIHCLFQFSRQLVSDRTRRAFLGGKLIANLAEIGAICPSHPCQLGGRPCFGNQNFEIV